MNSQTLITLACVGILAFALAQGAPTSDAPVESGASEVTSSSATQSGDLASSAPATEGTQRTGNTDNTTSSMAVSSAHDQLNASSFTCYGRLIGYYGDIEHDCKVYHFCLLGDYNGDPVYQRISYLCLNNTVFDQQALDCVEPAKMSSPCKESANFYDSSNAILREAIVGNQKSAESDTANKPATPTSTSAAPAASPSDEAKEATTTPKSS